MELYVFLTTSFIRLAAAMVIFFNCSSANVSSISINSPVGVPGLPTVNRLIKLKAYKIIRAQRLLFFISRLSIEVSELPGKNKNKAIAKPAAITKTLI